MNEEELKNKARVISDAAALTLVDLACASGRRFSATVLGLAGAFVFQRVVILLTLGEARKGADAEQFLELIYAKALSDTKRFWAANKDALLSDAEKKGPMI